MGQRGGRDEYEGARWELNHQPKLPENQVTAFGGVKASKGLDSAPAERAVQDISVLVRPNVGPEIEGSGGKYAMVFPVRVYEYLHATAEISGSSNVKENLKERTYVYKGLVGWPRSRKPE